MSQKTFKFKYNPGSYPTPMIMMYEEPNLNVFNDEEYTTSFGKWDNTNKCIWTIGAYLIYDDNKVIAYKFNEFANLTWLMRHLNKPLIIEVDEQTKNQIIEMELEEFQLV